MYALLADLACNKTISAKEVRNKNLQSVTPIKCVTEQDIVRAGGVGSNIG